MDHGGSVRLPAVQDWEEAFARDRFCDGAPPSFVGRVCRGGGQVDAHRRSRCRCHCWPPRMTQCRSRCCVVFAPVVSVQAPPKRWEYMTCACFAAIRWRTESVAFETNGLQVRSSPEGVRSQH